ncbi:uncharacterized protein RB166_006592 [Leptodactylus fuscus]|uniref:uncharacterized protein LOC142200081 n=1 Tax=Leptodactylus fuscus TaxID=238119 RepID=UPI003F4EC729
MSKKPEVSKLSHPHRTSVEQLLKCYGSDNSRKLRKAETKPVISRTYSDSSTMSHLAISRHLEHRLRPLTCAACRACVSSSVANSTPEVPKLQPLDQTHHLPYYPAKTNKKRPKARHKIRPPGEVTVLLQIPHSHSLPSCNGKKSRSPLGLASSCSSRSSEEKTPPLPRLPALPQPHYLPTHTGKTGVRYNATYRPDPDLRQWIVEFGGDEQAAFMARGLQRLQLAYERGKAEMYQTSPCKPSTNQ